MSSPIRRFPKFSIPVLVGLLLVFLILLAVGVALMAPVPPMQMREWLYPDAEEISSTQYERFVGKRLSTTDGFDTVVSYYRDRFKLPGGGSSAFTMVGGISVPFLPFIGRQGAAMGIIDNKLDGIHHAKLLFRQVGNQVVLVRILRQGDSGETSILVVGLAGVEDEEPRDSTSVRLSLLDFPESKRGSGGSAGDNELWQYSSYASLEAVWTHHFEYFGGHFFTTADSAGEPRPLAAFERIHPDLFNYVGLTPSGFEERFLICRISKSFVIVDLIRAGPNQSVQGIIGALRVEGP